MTNWNEVGRQVAQRRGELGLTQEQIPGVSSSTVRLIERGARDSYRAATLAAVEKALRWASGSIENGILRGEQPEEREWPEAPIDPENVTPLGGRIPFTPRADDEVNQILGTLDEAGNEIAWLTGALALLPSMEPLPASPRRAAAVARRLGVLAEEVLEFHAQLGETIDSLGELVREGSEVADVD